MSKFQCLVEFRLGQFVLNVKNNPSLLRTALQRCVC